MCLYARVNVIFAPWPPLPRPEPVLAERLALVLDNLRRDAASDATRNWIMGPLINLFWTYVASVIRRFAALAARHAAGTLRPPPSRPRSTPPSKERDRSPPKPRVPYRFRWLVDMMGYRAIGYGAQIRHMMIHDTELAALMAADPRTGRLLRPLCRMLGMEPGPDLPPSLFPPRAAKPPEAEPEAAPSSLVPSPEREPIAPPTSRPTPPWSAFAENPGTVPNSAKPAL